MAIRNRVPESVSMETPKARKAWNARRKAIADAKREADRPRIGGVSELQRTVKAEADEALRLSTGFGKKGWLAAPKEKWDKLDQIEKERLAKISQDAMEAGMAYVVPGRISPARVLRSLEETRPDLFTSRIAKRSGFTPSQVLQAAENGYSRSLGYPPPLSSEPFTARQITNGNRGGPFYLTRAEPLSELHSDLSRGFFSPSIEMARGGLAPSVVPNGAMVSDGLTGGTHVFLRREGLAEALRRRPSDVMLAGTYDLFTPTSGTIRARKLSPDDVVSSLIQDRNITTAHMRNGDVVALSGAQPYLSPELSASWSDRLGYFVKEGLDKAARGKLGAGIPEYDKYGNYLGPHKISATEQALAVKELGRNHTVFGQDAWGPGVLAEWKYLSEHPLKVSSDLVSGVISTGKPTELSKNVQSLLHDRGIPFEQIPREVGNEQEFLDAVRSMSDRFHQDAKGGNTRSDAKGGDTGSAEDKSFPEPGGRGSVNLPPQTARRGRVPRIVINPSTFRNEKDALCVAFNEAFRLVMEEMGFNPVAEPTEAQRRFFSDTAYANDELQLRRTILARICTFDTSVKDPTDEQLQEAVEFLGSVLESGAPQNEWEEGAVMRLRDVIAQVAERGRRTGMPPGPSQAPGTSPAGS